jgi:RHS repeat-associated protein
MLYTPDLHLYAETEATTAANPPIAWEYVWFNGEPLAQVETGTGNIRWYFNDHLGAPLLQTNATGAVVWRAERDPYGERFVVRTGAELYQALGLPGQEVRPEDGDRHYNIARWYRPGMGRFLSVDPTWESADFGLPQTWNRYSYVLNNPTLFSDPDGRCPIVVECVALGALGKAAFVVGTTLVVGAISETEVNGKPIGEHVGEFLLSGGGSSGEMAAETMISNWQRQQAAQLNSLSEAKGDDAVAPQKGERATQGTAQEAEEKLAEIEKQQDRTRTGKANGVIEDTSKSKQRMKERHKKIRNLKDAEEEYD